MVRIARTPLRILWEFQCKSGNKYIPTTYKTLVYAAFNDGKDHVQMFLPIPLFSSLSASAFFYCNS